MNNILSPRKYKHQLPKIYRTLLDAYGQQSWWPGDSPFEIMIGAILTQNTAWINVEKAIANLKLHDAIDPHKIIAMESQELAELLKPSGYFNVKAQRLKNYCHWYIAQGGFSTLAQRETGELRLALLNISGVGPETADDILLYAFQRPVFVIDAYTRRLLQRFELIEGNEDYEVLRRIFETALPEDAAMFNEYHALIVRHAKEACYKNKPSCVGCCLRMNCAFSSK